MSLKLELNQELKKEGIARDVLRTIQNKRKDLNFDSAYEFVNLCMWQDFNTEHELLELDEDIGEEYDDSSDSTLKLDNDESFVDFCDKHGILWGHKEIPKSWYK